MNLNEWFQKNNITSNEVKFYYTAWFNHQATERHKKNMMMVNPKQIKVSDKSLEKELHIQLKDHNSTFFNEIFQTQPDLKEFGHDLSDLPTHLVSPSTKQMGWRNKNYIKTNIDYSVSFFDLRLIDGLYFDEYSIYLPKNSEEVLIGGRILANCMGSMGERLVKEFMTDPVKFQKEYKYIDAHILKDNKLVGVFAIEEILFIKDHGRPKRSLFVNYANYKNAEMERLLLNIIEDKYNIKPAPYYNSWEEGRPVSTHNSFSGNHETRRLIEETIAIIKSKVQM